MLSLRILARGETHSTGGASLGLIGQAEGDDALLSLRVNWGDGSIQTYGQHIDNPDFVLAPWFGTLRSYGDGDWLLQVQASFESGAMVAMPIGFWVGLATTEAAAETGSGHRDVFIAGPGGGALYGGGGDDILDAGTIATLAPFTLDGGAGDDTILGNAGADTILGRAGADTIVGGGGEDLILGGPGADTAYGDAGATLAGGAGDDYLYGGTLMAGGAGADTLSAAAIVSSRLAGGEGDDALYGWQGDDLLSGSAGNDLLLGGSGADTLRGQDGADTLDGSEGNDVLIGGAGVDLYRFTGEFGADTIIGADGDRLLIKTYATTYEVLTTPEGAFEFRGYGASGSLFQSVLVKGGAAFSDVTIEEVSPPYWFSGGGLVNIIVAPPPPVILADAI